MGGHVHEAPRDDEAPAQGIKALLKARQTFAKVEL